MLRLLTLALVACHVQGQAGPPVFVADDVRPHGWAKPFPLRPGALAWIFGHHLSRPPGCAAANPMDPATYKTELCGTRVLVGGIEAPLIFVSDSQINLRLPDHDWDDEMVTVQVVRDGTGSAAVPVRFGPARPRLSLAAPAYSGMPVWLRIQKPLGSGTLRYPFYSEPWDLGPACLEVRYGIESIQPLSQLPHFAGCNSWGGWTLGLPGDVPEEFTNRLPLHLVYSLERAGTYHVRYSEYRAKPGSSDRILALQSEWTAIEIQPSTEAQRSRWLQELPRQLPTVELLTDYLPSLLAARDEKALRLLARYLNHPNHAVRSYAGYALNYFDAALLNRVAPGRRPLRGSVR